MSGKGAAEGAAVFAPPSPRRVEMREVSIIVPAYNEERAIGSVVEQLRARFPDTELLVVDDGSSDRTAEVALRAGAQVIRHDRNLGYGSSLKSGLRRASRDNAVFFDGDGQHDSEDVLRLVERLQDADMVVGARTGPYRTPLLRRPGKRILGWAARVLLGQPIPDLNSGLRAVRKEPLLRYLHLMPGGFSFSTTTTFAFNKANRRVVYVPIEVRRREGKSTVSQFRDGSRTLMLMLNLVVLFEPLKVFLTSALAVGALGIASLVRDIGWGERGIADTTVLLLLAAVIIFFFGLLAEQVAAMRREKHE